MQKANRPSGRWRYYIFGLAAIIIILADQLAKTWIRDSLARGQVLFDLGIFQFIHVQNTGAAFGIFQGYSLVIGLTAFVGICIVVTAILLMHRRWPFFDNNLVWLAMGLIVGGTFGNLVDRFRLGHVTDFIDFKFWPVFNIADACVDIGFVIIVYLVLRAALAAGKPA